MPSEVGRLGPRGPQGPRGPTIFRSPPVSFGSLAIAGVTRNASGAVLPNCIVQLFRTSDDLLMGEQTSDGAGSYSFPVQNDAASYYVVAYLAGAPDVAGTTVNTLVGA